MRHPRVLCVRRICAAWRSDPNVAIRASLGRKGAPLTAAVASVCLTLCSPPLRAGEAVVTAPKAVVRTAPFEVAPVLTELHAGDRLTADDWPQGGWRRVKLADGRFGLVHDADLKVKVTAPAPRPPAPTVTAPASPPSAQRSGAKPDPWAQPPGELALSFAGPPAWGLLPPPPVSARAGAGVVVRGPPVATVVTASDATVRTAPFEVAPVLTHVHAGDELVADAEAVGAWRRVKLPDGRFGLVHDADVKVTGTPRAVPAPPPPPPRLTVSAQEAIVVLPASGRGVAAPILQFARQLLMMDLAADLRLYVINFERPPVAIQLPPHVLARVAASVGGRLAVALDVSREAGITTFDLTCYDAATAQTVCHARESTTAGPEVVPAIAGVVAAGAAQRFDVLPGGPPLVETETRRQRSDPDALPPHTFRLGARGLVMVPFGMVRRQPEPLGGVGLTVTANVRSSFVELLGDFGTSGGLSTLGVGLGVYRRLSEGEHAPFVGGSIHYVSQHFGGVGAAGGQLRPTVGYALWRDQPVEVRVYLSYFVDLFEERTVDRLIKGYDGTYVSHGPMLALGAAF
jgi:hypothetical protein